MASKPKEQIIYYDQAVREIKQGKISRVYLLFGPETLLADKLIQLIQEKFLGRAEREINYFIRYATEVPLDEIISLTGGMGLFASKKVLLVREAQVLKKADLERLRKVIERLPADICLILQTNITNLFQSRLKQLQETAHTINLLPLRDEQLKAFVQEEFGKYGKQITDSAVDMLIFMVGNQLSELIMQIQQIAQYYQEKTQLEEADIERVASIYVTQDVFDYNNYLAELKVEKALFVLHNLLDSGVSPQQILAQLQRHFTLLWKIQGYYRSGMRDAYTISRELNIYSKYFPQYEKQARRWKTEQLLNILKELQRVDFQLKDSGVNAQNVLDLLNFKIINYLK